MDREFCGTGIQIDPRPPVDTPPKTFDFPAIFRLFLLNKEVSIGMKRKVGEIEW